MVLVRMSKSVNKVIKTINILLMKLVDVVYFYIQMMADVDTTVEYQ